MNNLQKQRSANRQNPSRVYERLRTSAALDRTCQLTKEAIEN